MTLAMICWLAVCFRARWRCDYKNAHVDLDEPNCWISLMHFGLRTIENENGTERSVKCHVTSHTSCEFAKDARQGCCGMVNDLRRAVDCDENELKCSVVLSVGFFL